MDERAVQVGGASTSNSILFKNSFITSCSLFKTKNKSVSENYTLGVKSPLFITFETKDFDIFKKSVILTWVYPSKYAEIIAEFLCCFDLLLLKYLFC